MSRRTLRLRVRCRALADAVRRFWCGCPLALRMLAVPMLCMVLLTGGLAAGWNHARQVQQQAVALREPASAAMRNAALQRLQAGLAQMQVDVHRLASVEPGSGGQMLAAMLRTRLRQDSRQVQLLAHELEPFLEQRISAYQAQVELAVSQMSGDPAAGRVAAELAAARYAALRNAVAVRLEAEQRKAQAAQAELDAMLDKPYGVYWPLALALATLAALSAVVSAWLSLRPLHRLAPAMTRLAGGDTQLGDLGAHRQDDLGAMAAAVAVFQRNALELHHTQQALQAAESQLASVIQAMPNGVAVFDSAQRLVLFNEPFVQLVQLPRAALAGQRWVELALRMTQADGDTAEWEHAVNCWFDSPGRTLRHEVRLGQHWLLFACNRIDGRNMKGGGLVLVLTDLTRRKQMEEELRQLALNDALTRLPNRRLFMDRLAHAAQASQRRHSHGAVLFIDLNKFKQLNDQHGHEAGDLLLMEVAHRLLLAARASDTVARLGGDEFVVLAEGLGEDRGQAEAAAALLAEKLHEALDAPYLLGALLHHGSASIGVSVFMGGEMDPAAILREADAAMYRYKTHHTGHGM
ncbi:hypothetical protein GCM10027277_29050 [Pseudoduganella ginsengisoli]|uniref:Diguanylate cyclase n=1 Tax=Pseudoduganella ginsengisoli TaxID=1462440 RepID=A0A6L6Q0I5_9BURK|nr:sensor domain-containing diguanylate cyclase [Pseudoduganella ginsengisoli]MTW03006.1 diguanylate cyclase [Pseudoduganella ginsengisoli]